MKVERKKVSGRFWPSLVPAGIQHQNILIAWLTWNIDGDSQIQVLDKVHLIDRRHSDSISCRWWWKERGGWIFLFWIGLFVATDMLLTIWQGLFQICLVKKKERDSKRNERLCQNAMSNSFITSYDASSNRPYLIFVVEPKPPSFGKFLVRWKWTSSWRWNESRSGIISATNE